MAIPSKSTRVELSERALTSTGVMVQSELVTTLKTERVIVGSQTFSEVEPVVEDKVHSIRSKFDQRSYNHIMHLREAHGSFFNTLIYKLRNFHNLACKRRKETERMFLCIIYKRTGIRVSFPTVRLLNLVGCCVHTQIPRPKEVSREFLKGVFDILFYTPEVI